MERKIGTVYSSNPKGWMFVYVTPQERYFLHISELNADHLANLGERVSFEIAPPLHDGKLPRAVNAVIVEPVSGQVGGGK
jgi:cold shock CspA family protein